MCIICMLGFLLQGKEIKNTEFKIAVTRGELRNRTGRELIDEAPVASVSQPPGCAVALHHVITSAKTEAWTSCRA